MSQQLPLDIRLADSASFASFYPGPNRQVVDALVRCAHGNGDPFVFIHAPSGSGKSHLLQAACRSHQDCGGTPVFVPLAEFARGPADILAGLERCSLVCLDDLQAIAGDRRFEQALFNLFNDLRERDGRLIAAADQAPGHCGFALADLASRLGSGVTYRLSPLDDSDKLSALCHRAGQLGFDLPADTGEFLLRRCPRDPASLFALLDELDHAALASQRRLTVPFVREILEARSFF